jgi:hypothetical protein
VRDPAISSLSLLPHSTPDAACPILSFNTTTSTFLAYVKPSCNRTVGEAESSLTGPGYGISYRTGLLLRGGSPASSERRGNDTAFLVPGSAPAPNSVAAAANDQRQQFLQ